MQSNFRDLLVEIISKVEGKDSESIDIDRLLCFIDPPAGILETAKVLHKMLNGQRLSNALLLPSNQDSISQSSFQRCCKDTARCNSMLQNLPPHEELEDLFQYLSNSHGLVRISDLTYFVESDSLKRIAHICQELRCMNAILRKDLHQMGGESNHISIQDLNNYVDVLFGECGEKESGVN